MFSVLDQNEIQPNSEVKEYQKDLHFGLNGDQEAFTESQADPENWFCCQKGWNVITGEGIWSRPSAHSKIIGYWMWC